MGMGASGVMGIVSGVLSDVSGKMAARERTRGMFQQAQDAELQAKLEEINAKSTEGDLRDQLLRTLSANNAAAGASGVALGSGVLQAGAQDDISQAFTQIQAVNLTAMLKAGGLRRQANTLRKTGQQTAILGSLGAAGQGLSQAGGSMGGGGS